MLHWLCLADFIEASFLSLTMYLKCQNFRRVKPYLKKDSLSASFISCTKLLNAPFSSLLRNSSRTHFFLFLRFYILQWEPNDRCFKNYRQISSENYRQISSNMTIYCQVGTELKWKQSLTRGGYSFLKRSVKTLAKLGPQSWLPLMSAINKNPCE